MRGPKFIKYVIFALCAAFLGVAALIDFLVRRHDLPRSILEVAGACMALAIMLPVLWFWRQRNRLDGTVL